MTSAVADQLRGTALFAAAPDGLLDRLAQRASPRRLAAGQVLAVEGEDADHLFVVASGRLRVLVGSARGDELTLTVLGPGDTVGELSVVDGRPRSATVEALDRVELLALPATVVREALLAEPGLLLAVAAELAGTVRRLTGATADLVFLDLPRRVAKLLLTEAVHGPDGVPRVPPGTSQSALAARLGAGRQAVNRALSGLARRGWVAPDPAGLALVDPAALERFAGS